LTSCKPLSFSRRTLLHGVSTSSKMCESSILTLCHPNTSHKHTNRPTLPHPYVNASHTHTPPTTITHLFTHSPPIPSTLSSHPAHPPSYTKHTQEHAHFISLHEVSMPMPQPTWLVARYSLQHQQLIPWQFV
jgi:hypothetical protein